MKREQKNMIGIIVILILFLAYSALQAEYGKDIMFHPEKDTSSLWVAGISLGLILVFLGYIFSRKTKMDIIPDINRYERQFEEEYRNFVSEIDEPNKNVKRISKDIPTREDKW